MNNTSVDVFRATISGIWMAIGSLILLCGVGCLIGYAVGGDTDGTSLVWCGVGCALGGPALIGAGVAAYYLFRPRSRGPA
jgi:hypothetical protein